MPKVMRPAPIELEDGYELNVKLDRTVLAGTTIFFQILYETSKAEDHQPSVELLRDPDKHPETPKNLGPMTNQNKIASFEFKASKPGTYAFRVRPFHRSDWGDLVEIHTITQGEAESLNDIVKKFGVGR
jgi:hypothetical protein